MVIRFALQKIARALVTIWLCVTFVFVILRLSGDPTTTILPLDAITEEARALYRQRWGLDQPIFSQYLNYFGNILRGDLGFSFRDGRDAVDVVAERVPRTLELMLVSAVVTFAIGIPAGVYAALNRNSLADRAVMTVAVLGFSVPNFVLAVLLILLFAVTWRVLPTSGTGTWQHLVMPVICLSTNWAGVFARFTRSAMLEVLGRDYVRAARARGVPWYAAVRRHALPNAAIPIAAVAGIYLGGLIVGSLIVESVFAWPGVGRLLVDAVGDRDLAVVQVIILLAAAAMVTANLLIDLAYGWLDPRVRAVRGGS